MHMGTAHLIMPFSLYTERIYQFLHWGLERPLCSFAFNNVYWQVREEKILNEMGWDRKQKHC